MTEILPKGTKVRIIGDSQYEGTVCEILSYNPGADEVQYTTKPLSGPGLGCKRLYLDHGDFVVETAGSQAVSDAERACHNLIEEIEAEKTQAIEAFDKKISQVLDTIALLQKLR